MTDTANIRTRHIAFRVTEAEHDQIERAADGRPVGPYLRHLGLQLDAPPPRRRRKAVKEDAPLRQVLAILGQSNIPNNLNQLTRAANSGSLDFTPDTEAAIFEACNAVLEIRSLLFEALGLEDR